MDRNLHITPETVELMFPLKVEDDVLLDSRDFIIAEFCCETWKQTEIANKLNTLAAQSAEIKRLREALEWIAEIGTRQSLVRIGDMYDMKNGYDEVETVSEEAELAREALSPAKEAL